jgi:hypothetical protein
MPTAPLRRSNPVVAPHTSSTNSVRTGSGMWTVKAVSARSGRQATVPVTISTGSWRMAASLVLDSPSSTADPFLLGVTGDRTLATYRRKSPLATRWWAAWGRRLFRVYPDTELASSGAHEERGSRGESEEGCPMPPRRGVLGSPRREDAPRCAGRSNVGERGCDWEAAGGADARDWHALPNRESTWH